MKKHIIILSCLLLLGITKSFSQEFSKNALFGSVGIGSSNNSVADGLGMTWGIGYQRDIWKNRLRIVPNLNFGTYTNKGTTDVPDAYYNSISLKCNINLDVLKIKSFSLFIGTGLTGNYTSGLVGTGGWPGRTSSDYFNETHFTFNGLLGLRLNPKTKRLGYELVLLNGSFENKEYFSELTVMQVRIIFKLK